MRRAESRGYLGLFSDRSVPTMLPVLMIASAAAAFVVWIPFEAVHARGRRESRRLAQE